MFGFNRIKLIENKTVLEKSPNNEQKNPERSQNCYQKIWVEVKYMRDFNTKAILLKKYKVSEADFNEIWK